MPLRQQTIDDLGSLAAWSRVDIPPGAPFNCSTVINPADTPLVYPTGILDVANYAAVALIMAGTGAGLASLAQASINGIGWVNCYGWPISGGSQRAPGFLSPTATPASGEKDILYIFPVEYANFFRLQLRQQTSGTTYFIVGLLPETPFIPGQNLQAKDYVSNGWNYAAASGGIVNNTAVTIKAAAGTGIRNYLSTLVIKNVNATATDYSIRDGSGGTVLHRGYLPASMLTADCMTFGNPLRTTSNTLMEIIMGTTGAQVYVNATGYVGP